MELSHDFTVPASVDDAWATFMDLERVGSCFPGATITSVDESGFAGTGQFTERDDTAHRAVIEAKGKDKRGNGTAGATVTLVLVPSGDGTRIDVTTDLSITGKPAQFGRGVMQDVSDKLLQQFVACIEGQFAPPVEPEPVVEPAPVDATPAAAPASAAPAPAPAAAPVATRPPRPAVVPDADESIDLGATVLPVLVKNYAPYAVAALAGLVLGWLVGRRRS